MFRLSFDDVNLGTAWHGDGIVEQPATCRVPVEFFGGQAMVCHQVGPYVKGKEGREKGVEPLSTCNVRKVKAAPSLWQTAT